MDKGKRATAAAMLALMLGLGVTPALAQDGKAQTQAAQLEALGKRPNKLFKQGKYVEALAAAEEFAKATEQAETAKGKPGASTANVLNSVAWNALFAKRFEQALEAADRAASLAPASLFIQGNRAHALMFLGRAEDALAVYVEHKGEAMGSNGKWEDVAAQDFDEFQKHGLNSPLTQRVKEVLAAAPESPKVLLQQGRALAAADKEAEALPLFQRYAEIVKARLGEGHPDFAEALRVQERALSGLDRYAEAEPLIRKALAIDEKAFGPEHPIVAVDINNLALMLKETNRLAEAEPLYRRSLAIDEKNSGSEHPDVAVGLHNLAQLLEDANRFAEAEPLIRRALAINEKAFGPDHSNVARDLDTLGLLLKTTNRYAEAEPLLRRALAIQEKNLGPDHPSVALSLNNLASLLNTMSRAAEAEPLMRRTLAIQEKKYGAEHPGITTSLNNLAMLLMGNNQLAEAETLVRRAIGVLEKAGGETHPKFALSLNNLAQILQETNRLREAEPLLRRALAIKEKTYGPNDLKVAVSVNNLGQILRSLNRFPEAEALMRRALVINENALGSDHPSVATNLSNLASFLGATNRYAEAEPLSRRALAIFEKSYGAEHPATAIALNNFASLLDETNRLAEAEPLRHRALDIDEKAYGPEHPDVAIDLNNLALLLVNTNRAAEAEPLYRRALAIFQKAYGPEHPQVALTLNNLAHLFHNANRLAEAEPLLRQALAITEKSARPDHPDTALRLNNLAMLLLDTNRSAEAEPLLRQALAINEKSYGQDHPDVARNLKNLSELQIAQGNWSNALQSARRSTAIRVASARLMRGQSGGEKRQLALSADQFRNHALIAFRAAHEDAAARDEAFAMAQRVAANEAAGALAQALARFATGNDALATLAREQQDLARQGEALDKRLLDVLGKADKAAAEDIRAEQAKAGARLDEIAAQLAREHPDYVALVNPEPLTMAETQALLAPDEAFVQFLDVAVRLNSPLPEAAFAFVITKAEVRWIELPLGSKALGDRVAALRCGLDSGAWKGEASRCGQLLGKAAPGDDLPPFDLTRANALYRDLFGQAEDLIKDKRLLIAPSGALTQLPFQVLVTEAPDASAKGADVYAKARWLGARNAISVLPSAASLKLLRMGKQGSASDPFLGFGNPLLNGGGDRSAWNKQACAKTTAPQGAKRSVHRAAPPALNDVYRGAVANVEMLRQSTPLPETADELCAVAHNLGAPDSSVYLGERATVSQIKALSASGALGRARAIHFATHGLVAGETALFLRNRAEPALLMTPPAQDKVTLEDDGLLKASDVTQLKLNADWVVMSACNTAAGGEGGEALSGLARAFFYAGARSMLVSHWYVDSNAAVEITTGAFSALKANPAIGRDEALRRSLSALIAKGGDNAHPSVWAPFVLVGDGGRTTSLEAAARKASPPSETILHLHHTGVGKLAAISSGGRRAVAPAQDGAVTVWDLETGKPVHKFIGSAAQGKAFSLSADGRLLAAAAPDGASVGLWDADSGQLRGSIAAGAGRKFSREAVVLSPDGRWLAAEQYGASEHGASVGVWDAASGRLTRMLEAKFDDVRALAFSGDGGRLAVSDSKGALLVFDVKTGKTEFSAKLRPADVRLAALSADGRVLAAAGASSEIRLWDAVAGKQLDAVTPRAGAIAALAFAPDGRLLIAGGDGTVELREAPALAANGR
jgi:tetratricopeptide (TPR) repeat protein/CHAT domain-containing protein